MNWMAMEAYLKNDDRVVLPTGSTEQHGYLSLGTDAILAQAVSERAAEPLGIPVLPVLPFGMAPYFVEFPGSMTLKMSTYTALIIDILENLTYQGFRRIAIINGHGGNAPVAGAVRQWCALEAPKDVQVLFHSWYSGDRVARFANDATDAPQRHGSWFERCSLTVVDGAQPPLEPAEVIDMSQAQFASAKKIREMAPSGSFGGPHVLSGFDEEGLLEEGVLEVRELLEHHWSEVDR